MKKLKMNPKHIDEKHKAAIIAWAVKIGAKKSGKNYKLRCPIHKERTPSFMISPWAGMIHCFGCGFHANLNRHTELGYYCWVTPDGKIYPLSEWLVK